MAAELALVGNASSLHTSGRRARRVVEESREQVAAAIGAEPGRGRLHLPAAPRRTTWRSRASTGPAARRTRAGVGCWPAPSSTTPCWTRCEWLAEHEGAEVGLAAGGRRSAGSSSDAVVAAIAEDPDSVALISVMWANNEVGTVQPVADVVAAAQPARHPGARGRRAGARPAAGGLRRLRAGLPGGQRAQGRRPDRRRCPAGQARPAAGAGAARWRPGAWRCAPARWTRRRSAALGAGGRARGVGPAGRGGRGWAGCATRWSTPCSPRCRTPCCAATRTRRGGCPATRTSPSPAARATRCCTCWTPAGWSARTGSACQAGVPQPSHVLLAMGVPEIEARAALRFSLGRTSTAAGRRGAGRGDRSGGRAGPPGRPGRLAGLRRAAR